MSVDGEERSAMIRHACFGNREMMRDAATTLGRAPPSCVRVHTRWIHRYDTLANPGYTTGISDLSYG
jgi:hypothetical protein